LLLNQIQERKKEKINEKTTKFMSGAKKPSCPWNKDIIVWEKWEMEEENERKNEKSENRSCERKMRNKIDDKVDEWTSLIKIGEYFHHQNFLVKVVRLLGVIF